MDKKVFVLYKKVLKYVEDNHLIEKGDTIIVALSGGADSVALLYLLINICKDYKASIKAVHVHHGIREQSADDDMDFCIKLCSKLDILLITERIDVPKEAASTRESIEECARRMRYAILNREAAATNNAKIAVAHHMDDQAETVMFRMLRGSGIKGMGAMSPKNDNIIRPLLCLKKEEILEYLESIGQTYCTDETNSDDNYARNHIRLNVLPKLKEISPKYVEHIFMLSNEAKEVSDYIEKCAHLAADKARISSIRNEQGKITKESYDINALKEEDKVIILQVIRLIIGRLSGLKDITRDHVERIYGLFEKSESKSVNLPGGIVISKNGSRLDYYFDNKKSSEPEMENGYSEEIQVNQEMILPGGRVLRALEEENTGADIPACLYTKWLDYDKINGGLCARFRKEGDYLIVDEKGSKKSLSRYMIDEKIPKDVRENTLVIASGSRILWVVGYRISSDVKISENTKKVIKLEIKEQGHE